jgi:tRNA(adenine34) deaminase
MRLALEQAGIGAALGEVPVGAVLVRRDDGRLLGAAHNACLAMNDPSAHAEMLVLRRAGAESGNFRLTGGVLVATLEPCLMCAGALVQARVDGLVYGAADPFAGAVRSRLEALNLPFHNHKVWHMGGVEEHECAELLRSFFARRRSGRNRIDTAHSEAYKPSHRLIKPGA